MGSPDGDISYFKNIPAFLTQVKSLKIVPVKKMKPDLYGSVKAEKDLAQSNIKSFQE